MNVKIINNSVNELPKYAKNGDAGMDIRADFSKGLKKEFLFFSSYDDERKALMIFSGGRALIPTNIHVAVPKGYELQIRPRSGLALKDGITILNTPGTIDSGYTASIGIILINLGEEVFDIKQGDRIAQVVLNKFETINWQLVKILNKTERGNSGFGDSGIK